TQRVREKKENLAAIRPIIETILFCAEQELPFRGDCDSGLLALEKYEKKDGKFRALLRFRTNSGDEDLRRHFISSRKNATYMSPDIQNEIIQICSEIVIEEIMKKVNRRCGELLTWPSVLDRDTMVQRRWQVTLVVSSPKSGSSTRMRDTFIVQAIGDTQSCDRGLPKLAAWPKKEAIATYLRMRDKEENEDGSDLE
ncbi:hypothetical protein ILUMI_06489, partial [Ignelater luminosus]